MSLIQALGIHPGVTAIIGSGGKTSLLYALAKDCDGLTAVTTTTRIYPPEHLPVVASVCELDTCLKQESKTICLGSPCPDGKLSAAIDSIDTLKQVFDYVLIEADGSKGLPIKAHAPHEPVIPGIVNSNVPWKYRKDVHSHECRVVQVIGASGFLRPIADVCHRPALFCELAGCAPSDLVTPETLANTIKSENLADILFINQCDSLSDAFSLNMFQDMVSLPIVYGSLKEGWHKCLF